MTTMDRRLKLSEMLHDILGTDHVYYDPPETVKMKYPAIVYSRSGIDSKAADNIKYLRNDKFTLIFIRKDSDNSIIDKLLELPYCQHSSEYKTNGLYHDVFNVYI